MYFNDVHIAYYVVAAIVGLFMGEFVAWLNVRLPDYKKVFSKEFFTERKMSFKPNYILMLITAVIYVTLVYKFGIHNTIVGNLDLIKYLILTPMLLSAFVIDYKLQIIPNRLNLTIFELGLLFAFSLGNSNLNIATDAVLGMLIGGGIFLTIAIIGGVIAGKDAMGLGDVKLMGAIGLYFGKANIIKISILAFLVGAIISIVLLITKKNRKDGYVPFGPFIVIAAIIILFTPASILDTALLKIFSLGLA